MIDINSDPRALLNAILGGTGNPALQALAPTSAPAVTDEEAVLAITGRRCRIRGTGYQGTVWGYSRVDSRLPVLVSVDRTNAGEVNCVMPYSFESVIVLPVGSAA